MVKFLYFPLLFSNYRFKEGSYSTWDNIEEKHWKSLPDLHHVPNFIVVDGCSPDCQKKLMKSLMSQLRKNDLVKNIYIRDINKSIRLSISNMANWLVMVN